MISPYALSGKKYHSGHSLWLLESELSTHRKSIWPIYRVMNKVADFEFDLLQESALEQDCVVLQATIILGCYLAYLEYSNIAS